jgi:hypothetical protein
MLATVGHSCEIWVGVQRTKVVLDPTFHQGVLPANGSFSEWAMLGSNQRPLPCEGSALPLS